MSTEERVIKFRALYEGKWYYQTLEEILTVTLAAFRNGKHKTQYTGLKDYFEGDVLSEKWKAEIYKDDNTGAFMVKFHTNPEFNKPKTLYKYLKDRERSGTIDKDGKIIGNIYENKDLLTEK